MIENLIFNNILHNEDYARQVLPHLKEEYFYSDLERRLFKYCVSFFTKYNKLPTTAVLAIALEKDSRVSEDDYSSGIEFLNTLNQCPQDSAWMVDETEKFCKERSLYNALAQALEIKDNSEKPLDQQNKKLPETTAIPELLSNALGVSFDKSVGHDYFEDAEQRWEVYHNKEAKIPFDIDILNKITKGGVEYKTLNIIMAGVNVGKSLCLCHLAAAYLSAGHDVLYVSMEMSEIQGVAKRIDANLFDMALDDVVQLDPGTYNSRIKRLKDKITGKLIIKQYPTGNANVGHIKALLNELKQKKNRKPRIVMVDYLGIMSSMRIRGFSENTYALVGAIAEELRGLAIEEDLCIWSAAQTTRGSWGNSDMDMADVAESAKLPATCDFLLGVVETEETIALNQLLFKQIKSRYGNKDINTRFMLGVSKDKQKLFDVQSFNDTPREPQEQQRAKVASHGTPKHRDIDVSSWNFDE